MICFLVSWDKTNTWLLSKVDATPPLITTDFAWTANLSTMIVNWYCTTVHILFLIEDKRGTSTKYNTLLHECILLEKVLLALVEVMFLMRNELCGLPRTALFVIMCLFNKGQNTKCYNLTPLCDLNIYNKHRAIKHRDCTTRNVEVLVVFKHAIRALLVDHKWVDRSNVPIQNAQ